MKIQQWRLKKMPVPRTYRVLPSDLEKIVETLPQDDNHSQRLGLD